MAHFERPPDGWRVRCRHAWRSGPCGACAWVYRTPEIALWEAIASVMRSNNRAWSETPFPNTQKWSSDPQAEGSEPGTTTIQAGQTPNAPWVLQVQVVMWAPVDGLSPLRSPHGAECRGIRVTPCSTLA
jgi:hypothetical protein